MSGAVAATGSTADRRRATADDAPETEATGEAEYVFRVTVRLDPEPDGVEVEPATFETVLTRTAEPPGTDGWLFFRGNLWRGEPADEAHFRELTEEALCVPVLDVGFDELRTDETYLSAFESL